MTWIRFRFLSQSFFVFTTLLLINSIAWTYTLFYVVSSFNHWLRALDFNLCFNDLYVHSVSIYNKLLIGVTNFRLINFCISTTKCIFVVASFIANAVVKLLFKQFSKCHRLSIMHSMHLTRIYDFAPCLHSVRSSNLFPPKDKHFSKLKMFFNQIAYIVEKRSNFIPETDNFIIATN